MSPDGFPYVPLDATPAHDADGVILDDDFEHDPNNRRHEATHEGPDYFCGPAGGP